MLATIMALALGAAPPVVAPPSLDRQIKVEMKLMHGGDVLTNPTIMTLDGMAALMSVGQEGGSKYLIRTVPTFNWWDGKIHLNMLAELSAPGVEPYGISWFTLAEPGKKHFQPLGKWRGQEVWMEMTATEYAGD